MVTPVWTRAPVASRRFGWHSAAVEAQSSGGSIVLLFPLVYYLAVCSGFSASARCALPLLPFLCLTVTAAVTVVECARCHARLESSNARVRGALGTGHLPGCAVPMVRHAVRSTPLSPRQPRRRGAVGDHVCSQWSVDWRLEVPRQICSSSAPISVARPGIGSFSSRRVMNPTCSSCPRQQRSLTDELPGGCDCAHGALPERLRDRGLRSFRRGHCLRSTGLVLCPVVGLPRSPNSRSDHCHPCASGLRVRAQTGRDARLFSTLRRRAGQNPREVMAAAES